MNLDVRPDMVSAKELLVDVGLENEGSFLTLEVNSDPNLSLAESDGSLMTGLNCFLSSCVESLGLDL